jgi:hypothetical protein
LAAPSAVAFRLLLSGSMKISEILLPTDFSAAAVSSPPEHVSIKRRHPAVPIDFNQQAAFELSS